MITGYHAQVAYIISLTFVKPYLLSTFISVTSSYFVYLRLNLGRVFYSDLLQFLLCSLSSRVLTFHLPPALRGLEGA